MLAEQRVTLYISLKVENELKHLGVQFLYSFNHQFLVTLKTSSRQKYL